MTGTPVTVARYEFPWQAQIARGQLEAAGITAFVADEHTINMQWLWSNAMGGVRLQVPASDAERAGELLREDASQAVDKTAGPDDTPRCTQCDTPLQATTLGKKPAFMVFLLLGFPLFRYRRGYRCPQCGQVSERGNYGS